MKIVVLGANGQVGAEVCLRLAHIPEVVLIPVSRTRNGSSFLRSRGVSVWHGDPTNEAQARAMFAGADLIANFALAGGVGKVARIANEAIIDASIRYSPPEAKIIFFSTLAVLGSWDETGACVKGPYGDLKLSNERHFARAAERQRREGWTLRLGHVCGEVQGLTFAIRDEITRDTISLPDPERSSNTIHTTTICDAILAIAEGRASHPGRYDLVNAPQWPWRQVYEQEAASIDAPLTFAPAIQTALPPRRSVKAKSFALISRLGIRSVLERMLPLLSANLAEQIRADFMVSRTSGEIAALNPPVKIANSAALWPALHVKTLDGLRPTAALGDDFAIHPIDPSLPWPDDLQPALGDLPR
jgi:nucleoside-diphosphate-sugar epimerase